MASRRMMSLAVISQDAFMEMSLTTQALYFHLLGKADDHGFISSPKGVIKWVGAAEDDAKILQAKGYVLGFEGGTIAIRHWLLHNKLRKDRITETTCLKEKALLYVTPNDEYTKSPGDGTNISLMIYHLLKPKDIAVMRGLPDENQIPTKYLPNKQLGIGGQVADSCQTDGGQPADNRQTNDGQPAAQDSVGYGSVGYGSPAQANSGESKPAGADAPTRHKYGQYGWVLLTQEQHARLLADLGAEELSRCITYIDESAQSNGNKNKWRDWNLVLRRCSREGWGQNIRQSTPAKPDTLGILNRMMEESK